MKFNFPRTGENSRKERCLRKKEEGFFTDKSFPLFEVPDGS